MPGLNGIECVQTIRKYEKEGLLSGHIPVIAVSANARTEHKERAQEASMVSLAHVESSNIATMDRMASQPSHIGWRNLLLYCNGFSPPTRKKNDES